MQTKWMLLTGLALMGASFGLAQDVKGAGKAVPALQVEATPALWKVQGKYATVYLFGTVHVMKPEVHWETAKVKEAFAKSDRLMEEIADIDNMAAMQPLVMQLGMDADHPLSTKISKEDLALLDAAAKGLGAPGEQVFEGMRPWLLPIVLSGIAMRKAGYTEQSGIDMKLLAEARARPIPVAGFETAEQEMHFMADFPQDQQVAMLHQTLVDLPKGQAEIDEVVAAWTRGDVETIGRVENGAFQKDYPALYKRLVTDRNERMAVELAALLNGEKGGTIFVAVGAAHLAGTDSVQHDLELKGLKAVRQ